MTWQRTKAWTVGVDQGTAALWNAQARDNIQYTRDTVRRATVSVIGPVSAYSYGGGSYDQVGGANYVRVQLRKRQADSFIVIRYSLGGASTAAATSYRVGLGVNLPGGPVNAWVDGRQFLFNQVSVVKSLVGEVGIFPASAVGMYTVVLGIKATNAGGGSFLFNNGASAGICIYEAGLD